MTTQQTIPATQNEAWGFFGTMNDNAEAMCGKGPCRWQTESARSKLAAVTGRK